ncbi:unnamed protein product [Caretta caretta]
MDTLWKIRFGGEKVFILLVLLLANTPPPPTQIRNLHSQKAIRGALRRWELHSKGLHVALTELEKGHTAASRSCLSISRVGGELQNFIRGRAEISNLILSRADMHDLPCCWRQDNYFLLVQAPRKKEEQGWRKSKVCKSLTLLMTMKRNAEN